MDYKEKYRISLSLKDPINFSQDINQETKTKTKHWFLKSSPQRCPECFWGFKGGIDYVQMKQEMLYKPSGIWGGKTKWREESMAGIGKQNEHI